MAPVSRAAVAAAVNDRQVQAACLDRSPDLIDGALTLRTYEGYATAGLAYNQALTDAGRDVVVLVHQDVYLAKGFAARLEDELDALDRTDPDWAVAGVIGVRAAGEVVGMTWSSGIGRLVGNPVSEPVEVETLDELLLIVRRLSGVLFDPALPSFHLYGTDVVQAAKVMGLKSYVVTLPVVHHSRPVTNLGGGYRTAYRYMQKKWRAVLPLRNLVCPVEASIFTLLWRDLRLRRRVGGRTARAAPSTDPVDIARAIGAE